MSFYISIFAKWFYSQSEMSWVKAVPCSRDDVFDENADEMSVSNREWSASMKRRVRVSRAPSLRKCFSVLGYRN